MMYDVRDLYRDICVCSNTIQPNEVHNMLAFIYIPRPRKGVSVMSQCSVQFYIQHSAEAVTDTILVPYLRLLFK